MKKELFKTQELKSIIMSLTQNRLPKLLSPQAYISSAERYFDLTVKLPQRGSDKPPESDGAYLRCLEETKAYRAA